MKKTMTAKEILQRPYSRVLTPEEDGRFSAAVLEFPGCFSQGDSPAEAYTNLEEAANNWIEAALEQKLEIPEALSPQRAAGRVLVRLPRSLHQRLAMFAERDGVSLNQYIVATLAERAGAVTAGARLMTEAQRMIRGVALVLREAAGRIQAANDSVSNVNVSGYTMVGSAATTATLH